MPNARQGIEVPARPGGLSNTGGPREAKGRVTCKGRT